MTRSMTLPPRTGSGRGRTKLCKAAFAFLHACRFEAVQEREQLLLEPPQLRACLAESAIGVGQFTDLAEFLRGRGDVLGPALAAIREDGAGVQLSLGTMASGFSTASAEGVERAGQKRFAGEERFEEFLELWCHGEHLGAKRAEVASHGWVSRIAEVRL
jgi:hypothetical protein